MKIAQPPIFTQQHVNVIVAVAAEKTRPCLIVLHDPSLQMLLIATAIEDGIIHWTNTGPTRSDDISLMAEPFRIRMELDEDRVYFVEFDSSKILRLPDGNQTKH